MILFIGEITPPTISLPKVVNGYSSRPYCFAASSFAAASASKRLTNSSPSPALTPVTRPEPIAAAAPGPPLSRTPVLGSSHFTSLRLPGVAFSHICKTSISSLPAPGKLGSFAFMSALNFSMAWSNGNP